SVPVWFLWEGTTILIFSKPNNQKIRNLRQNDHVTLTLDDTKNGLDVVILEGTAELLEQRVEHAILQAFGEKYREGLQGIGVTVEEFITLYSQMKCVTPVRFLGWP